MRPCHAPTEYRPASVSKADRRILGWSVEIGLGSPLLCRHEAGGALNGYGRSIRFFGRSGRNPLSSAFFGSERSEEHTSELQSLMRISYAVFCLKKKKQQTKHTDQSIPSPTNQTYIT